ncbi:MAG: hypothetical protein GXP45_04925 [bacterium]|nr:hypothetical protein [bacterium]
MAKATATHPIPNEASKGEIFIPKLERSRIIAIDRNTIFVISLSALSVVFSSFPCLVNAHLSI